MFKTICKETDCANKDVPYYMPEISQKVMCGGCKKNITPIEMTQEEYDSVFDYDPFAVTPLS